MKSTASMGWITLVLSLAIAACAAYFSIAGLAVLFAAALWPVIIMATTLEVGKLGATFFLHRFWEELPFQIKYPMTGMVVILMIITSMGIFGFLSKGHIEQESPAKNIGIQIERIDQQISREQDSIKRNEERLARLQAIVDTLIDYDRIRGKDGADATLKAQQPERQDIQTAIDAAFDRINKLQEKKLPLKSEVSTIEAKLGPVKYVAELFGFDLAKDPDGKGKAVRIVIVLFMLAFDPLAIWLIMASDWAFLKYRRERKELDLIEEEQQEKELVKEVKTKEEEMGELEDALVQIYDQLEEKEMELKEYTAILEELGRTLDEKPTEVEKIVEIENTEKLEEMVSEIRQLEKQKVDLEQEMDAVRSSLMTKEQAAEELQKALAEVRDELNAIRQENNALRSDIEARDNAVMNLNKKYSLVEKIPGLSIKPDVVAVEAPTFGTEFPPNPVNDQSFLRVDEMPSKLYKFDGSRWLEVVKDEDVQYDEKYLQHLITELEEGRVELAELSDKEQQEIEKLLSNEDVLSQ